MLKLALAALILGAASAVSAPSPPLCRVQAVAHNSLFPGLRDILVLIRPGCPARGVAFVQLQSSSGATDPPGNRFLTLNRLNPAVLYRGVFGHWGVQWRDRAGRRWHVQED